MVPLLNAKLMLFLKSDRNYIKSERICHSFNFFFTCWTRCGQVGCGVGHTVVSRLTALTDLLVGEVIVGSCGTSNGICGSKRAIVGLRASSC